MKSTKYQLLKDDYDFVCKESKASRVLIQQQRKEIERLEGQLTFEKNACQYNFEQLEEANKEIEEHCETKGKLGKQVFALTKLVDEQNETILQYKKTLKELEAEKHNGSWIVYDWSDGLVCIVDSYEKAEKEYQTYKKHNQTYSDGEFDGDEEVIIAKIDKRFYARDTNEPVMKEDENGKEVPSSDNYWEWKEDKF